MLAGAGPDLRPFARDGFIAPVRIFSGEECRAIAAHLRHASHPEPAVWGKGRAVTDPLFHRLATHPGILSLLAQVLGENVILWGASAISRKPGQVHLWHTDIESAARAGFASIWIGIENTSRESGLLFASRSHGFGKPIQQVAHEHGARRGEISSETVLGWAREYDADSALVQPDVQDGEALLFDGRIWHCSHNTRATGERVALLLQYAAADAPVRMPDLTQLEWPFRFLETRPPAIVVRGDGRPGINLLAPPPAEPAQRPAINTWIHPLPLPLPEDPKTGWRPYHLFRGPTGALQEMACHVSVLSPGHSPHPPHIHPEEEVLIVLDGEAEIVFADDPQSTNARVERLGPGSFAFYPTDQHHTIRNASASPITYLMFKWLAAAAGEEKPLGASVFRDRAVAAPARSGNQAVLVDLGASHRAAPQAACASDEPAARRGLRAARRSLRRGDPGAVGEARDARASRRAARPDLLFRGHRARHEEYRKHAGALPGVRVPRRGLRARDAGAGAGKEGPLHLDPQAAPQAQESRRTTGRQALRRTHPVRGTPTRIGDGRRAAFGRLSPRR